MKSIKLLYASTVLLGAGMISSCSDNYLDLAPVTSVTNDAATSTVEGARLAMIGICQAMYQQYQDIGGSNGYLFFNGEAYVNHRLNDAFGPDLHSGMAMTYCFGPEIITQTTDTWSRDNYWFSMLVWKYCYNLIQQANVILDGIDDAEGDETERAFVKAQVLTLRAHGYTKLMQFYAPRWEDSNEGDVYCAVMRDHYTTEGAPLCKMNDVFKLIYSDLDTALELYQSSGMKRAEKWMPDLSVAYGIYARAAMIIHDYKTAQTMAHNAYQGYEIMDNNTYLSGLFKDNNDYMWISSTDGEDLYYWSELGISAPNGYYCNMSFTGDGIDIDLYNQIQPNDIRRQCYFMPDKIAYVEKEDSKYNPAKLDEKAFWNPDLVNPENNCDTNLGGYEKDKKNPNTPWGLVNVGVYYSYLYLNNIFKGEVGDIKNVQQEGTFYDYITLDGAKGDIRVSQNEYASLKYLPFGAQYKFWSVAPYSSGAYCFMRSTEFRFLEAEAAYYNGDQTTCRNFLNQIQGMRIPGYNFTGSGQALLDELRLAYRIETWGEGHSWTDFKRWNLPIVRRAWVANDPTSGNWQTDFGKTTPVNVNSGWRMRVPQAETRFNDKIDMNLLEQSYK